MPVYNGEAFIAEAVESVITQTYPNWELIVIDDGSIDHTAQIVATYHDPRLHYHYQSNQGLAGARNAALQLAQGDFVAFIDADDKWASEFLARCSQRLSAEPALGAVYTQVYHFDQNGRTLPRASLEICSRDQLHRRLLRGGFFPPSAVMARRSVLQQLGTFDTELAGAGTEDWELWLRLTRQYAMDGISELLAYYRIYPGSMSTNAERMQACRLSVLAKHVGPIRVPADQMSDDQRFAYGHAFVSHSLDCLMQHQSDAAWQVLTQAVGLYPPLLEKLEMYYELACGDQTRGYRGTPIGLDLDRNGAAMLAWLDQLFAPSNTALAGYRRTAYARAYLSLSILSDAIKRRPAARRFMWRAIKSDPRLLAKVSIVRRCVKLALGF